jgi:methionine-rich copper-binding protein CopC
MTISGVNSTRAPWSRKGFAGLLFLALVAALLVSMPSRAEAACSGNAIVCENQLPGTPESEWDINGAGDDSIQGFATKMSVNAGQQIQFKIDTDATAYSIKIYRLGYYQGNGAREITTINPSASLPQHQPACATDPDTGIYDCGTWAVSASWNVPSSAVSGVYFANLIRSNGDSSHIPFVVRNDNNTSKVLFQTSDTTWQAYNTYGGASFYVGGGAGRGFKLSYNRPWKTRAWQGGRDFLFSNEYPMIRFLEQNGYDMSYVSGLDIHSDANLITKHKVFLSVGHDEYWSKEQRDHVLAARDAGTNLAFFSGNEVYWKTRWEESQDGSHTPNRTLVCYKDTWANTQIDPVTPTATWRDPRFGDLGHGPENSLTGTMYKANYADLPIKVSATEGKLRMWRNTSLDSLTSGSTQALAAHTVGYESDEDVDNGYRPAGLIRMSTTTGSTPEYLTDFGNTVVSGTTTHHVTQYRAASGALVFSAGSVQWAWGLDSHHDGNGDNPDSRMRQATVNILADMDAPATTIASGLVASTKSTDTIPPTVTVTQPTSGAKIAQGSLVTVEGTADDTGGRVAGVEVSLNGGASWHPAAGRSDFSYTGVLYGSGANAIQVRAVDDSANLQANPAAIAITSDCPCSLFGAMTPTIADTADSSAVTLGTRLTPAADGFITGVRFYKGAGNTGTHVGRLYSASGAVLATGTFSNETPTGWQTLSFPTAVPVTADTTYVAAYYAPSGHYAGDSWFFASQGFSSGKLSAPGGSNNPNGVFSQGNGFPNQSYRNTNYYVDAIYSATDTTPLSVTQISPPGGSTSVPPSGTLTATFNRAVQGSSISFAVLDNANNVSPGTVSYDSGTKTATFVPNQPLKTSTAYTVTVTAQPAAGAGMAAPVQWSFTTAKPPATPGVCPCTLFDDADRPSNAPADDTDSVKLGIAFKADSPGIITGVRFYKDAPNTGTHTIALWKSDGTQLATGTVTSESTAGWQEASFSAPVAITMNTTYIASYTAPSGRYSHVGGGLASAIVRSPLRSLSTGGRYSYGSGAPLSSSSANYFVDPVFEYSADHAPEITSISPGDKATSVSRAGTVRVSFDRPIQAGTTKVTLKDPSNNVVSGNTTLEANNSTVTFVPASDLTAGTRYSVSVAEAKSLGGAEMTQAFTSQFTTSGPDACPCSLLETTTQPTLPDAGDPSALTLGLKFKPSVDGFIKGVRYYRDAANTGTHIGKLFTSSGTELASVTIPTQAEGWQSANFSSPVSVNADTTYIISYYAPNGHYAAANGYFATAVVNPPLSSSGAGGVYADGNNFPNQTYLNTNYYVDVIFTTDEAGPPAVVNTTPDNNANEVDVDTVVTAKFDRSITASSLDFKLTGPGTNAVSGQTKYDSSTRTATFTPSQYLAPGVLYTAKVSATSSGGVPMASPKTWTFTTVPPANGGTPFSLFPASSTPDVPAWNDSDPVTVGVRFSSSANGTVTAIKFYAGSGNTGPQTVTLWSSNGDQLGTGTSTASSTGWRTVNLTTPVQITAGDTYTASYRAPAGHYSVTSGGFNDSYSRGPLTVPAGGGTYRYSEGFPSASSNTNFWVDVVVII